MNTENKLTADITAQKNKIEKLIGKYQEIKIDSLHGALWIRNDHSKTYSGVFGNNILMQGIKHNCLNDNEKMLQIIATHCELYSRKIGGLVFILSKV